VKRVKEMMRFEKAGDAFVRIVVDKHCAQQRLLGLNVHGLQPPRAMGVIEGLHRSH